MGLRSSQKVGLTKKFTANLGLQSRNEHTWKIRSSLRVQLVALDLFECLYDRLFQNLLTVVRWAERLHWALVMLRTAEEISAVLSVLSVLKLRYPNRSTSRGDVTRILTIHLLTEWQSGCICWRQSGDKPEGAAARVQREHNQAAHSERSYVVWEGDGEYHSVVASSCPGGCIVFSVVSKEQGARSCPSAGNWDPGDSRNSAKWW